MGTDLPFRRLYVEGLAKRDVYLGAKQYKKLNVEKQAAMH